MRAATKLTLTAALVFAAAVALGGLITLNFASPFFLVPTAVAGAVLGRWTTEGLAEVWAL